MVLALSLEEAIAMIVRLGAMIIQLPGRAT